MLPVSLVWYKYEALKKIALQSCHLVPKKGKICELHDLP